MATPASFQLDIARFVDKAKGKTQQFAVEMIQELNGQVVEATPVKTGFLRNSWYASLNGEPQGQGGDGTVAQMNLTASELKIGDTFRASNGAAYAMRIEFGFTGTDSLGRHYDQHPQSFVRATLDRAPIIADEVAQKIASEP